MVRGSGPQSLVTWQGEQTQLRGIEGLLYLWVRLDDGHAAGAVRLFRVRPEEVVVVVGCLRLLLLRRDREAALGRLAGRHCRRGR